VKKPGNWVFGATRTPPITSIGPFVQILAKLHFFKLRENLRIILLDYGQKRPCIANATFKRAC